MCTCVCIRRHWRAVCMATELNMCQDSWIYHIIYIYIYIYIFIYIYTHVYTHTHTGTGGQSAIANVAQLSSTLLKTAEYHIYIYIHVCVCVCIYIYIYIYIHVCIYAHTYIHRYCGTVCNRQHHTAQLNIS